MRLKFNPWVRKIPQRRNWQTTPVRLPGKSHGHRGLVGYGPQDRSVGHDLEQQTLNFQVNEFSVLYAHGNLQRKQNIELLRHDRNCPESLSQQFQLAREASLLISASSVLSLQINIIILQAFFYYIYFLSISIIFEILSNSCGLFSLAFNSMNIPQCVYYTVDRQLGCLVTKSCLIFCDPMDCIPPGSSVHVISQARTREWIVISFSSGLPNPGTEPRSPAFQAGTSLLRHLGSPGYLY